MSQIYLSSADSKSPDRFRIALFDRGGVWDADNNEISIPRMGLILCAYLILDCPTLQASRVEVGRFLWADLDAKHQAGNVRQLFLRLKTAFAGYESGFLTFSELHISIDLSAVDVDLIAFQSALNSGAPDRFEQLSKAYAGDLLACQHCKGEHLAQWLRARATMIRAEFSGSIVPWLDGLDDSKNLDTTEFAARQLLKVEPYEEAGYRALLRIAAARKKYQKASQIYQKMKRVLAKDLGCEPTEKTQKFYNSLLNGLLYVSNTAPAEPKLSRNSLSVDASSKDVITPVQAVAAAGRAKPRVAMLINKGAFGGRSETEYFDYIVHDVTFGLWQTAALVISLPKYSLDEQERAPEWDYFFHVRLVTFSTKFIVHVQVLAAATREILWAKRFEGLENLAGDVSAIVQNVSLTIENHWRKFELIGKNEIGIEQLNSDAQRNLRLVDLPSIRRARNQFRTAIQLAPGHVVALSGLSRSYVMEWLLRMNLDQSLLLRAEAEARKIIAINPDSYRGYLELGVAQMYQKKFDNVADLIGRAKKIEPANTDIKIDFADALVSLGHPKEAIKILSEPAFLTSDCPDMKYWVAAGAYYYNGEYSRAIDEISAMRNKGSALRISAAAHSLNGNQYQAKSDTRQYLNLNPDFKVDAWISRVPNVSSTNIEHLSNGLRMAGFV